MAVTYYTITVRLKSLLTSGATIRPTVTVQTYYTLDVDTSVVHQYNNDLLDTTETNYYGLPNEFNIPRPRLAYETPRANYVGRYEVKFTPSSESLSAKSIEI